MAKYVVYYRVSAELPGYRSLDLEEQEAAVRSFLADQKAAVVGTFMEVESGQTPARPQLRAAVKMVKANGATLLVAKIGRLAKNASFLLSLKKARVKFLATDVRGANRQTVGLLVLLAEQEMEAMSARIKAALAVRKARNRRSRKASTTSTAAATEKADQVAQQVLPIITRLKGEGLSAQNIARRLNADGMKTARGTAWTYSGVLNMLRRLSACS